jgi:hypothetical protein
MITRARKLVIHRIVAPIFFRLMSFRLYKTQVIKSNLVRAYNRRLRELSPVSYDHRLVRRLDHE